MEEGPSMQDLFYCFFVLVIKYVLVGYMFFSYWQGHLPWD